MQNWVYTTFIFKRKGQLHINEISHPLLFKIFNKRRRNMSLSFYIQGHILLFRFFVSKLAIFSAMPDWIQNPAEMEKKLANHAERGSSEPLVMSISSVHAESYNKAHSELASQLRTLHAEQGNFAFR